jgi:hypothetical protein
MVNSNGGEKGRSYNPETAKNSTAVDKWINPVALGVKPRLFTEILANPRMSER